MAIGPSLLKRILFKGGIKLNSTSEFYVVQDKTIEEPEDNPISNSLMISTGRNVADKENLKQWELWLVDWKNGDGDKPHYSQFYRSVNGAGKSCAEGKMLTLKNHPEITNTGELKDRPDDVLTVAGEVSWYGGISIPYTGHEGPEHKAVKGAVYIVFSGAREAIDLAIVIAILKDYIKACDEFLPDCSYTYDISGLLKDQLSSYLWKIAA